MVLDFESVTKQSNIHSFSHLLLKQVKDLIFEISISGSFFSQKTKNLDYYTIYWFLFHAVDVLMRLLINYQVIKKTDMMFISLSVIHLQSYIS